MPTNVPLLTLDEYRAAFNRYRCEEAGDIAPSETVLGDGWHEAPIDIVFEMILFHHVRSHYPMTRDMGPKRELVTNCICGDYCREENREEKIHTEVKEAVLWTHLQWYMPLVRKLFIREDDYEKQVALANNFIDVFNRSTSQS